MDVYEITALAQGVYLLYEKTESVSMYLVCGKTRAALIDTGCGTGDLPAAVKSLTDLPVVVLLTHAHSDHYCGAFYYEKAYLDLRDLPLATAWQQEFAQMEQEAQGSEMETKALARMRAAGAPEWLPCPETIELGGRTLKTVDLHGHTQGSIGFLLQEDRILFSGDGLTYHVWMQLPESTTLEEYEKTLAALKPLQPEFDRICNGHGIKPDTAEHLDHVLDMVRRILAGETGTWMPEEYVPGWLVDGTGCRMLYLPEKVHGRTGPDGNLLPE